MFTPIWGRFPFWLIFLRWVETTNQLCFLSRNFCLTWICFLGCFLRIEDPMGFITILQHQLGQYLLFFPGLLSNSKLMMFVSKILGQCCCIELLHESESGYLLKSTGWRYNSHWYNFSGVAVFWSFNRWYFPLHVYRLESRCRNSHVLVYNSALLWS